MVVEKVEAKTLIVEEGKEVDKVEVLMGEVAAKKKSRIMNMVQYLKVEKPVKVEEKETRETCNITTITNMDILRESVDWSKNKMMERLPSILKRIYMEKKLYFYLILILLRLRKIMTRHEFWIAVALII